MSRIDRLIKQLCPNGVEWKELGEIGEFVRGNGLQKKDFTESGVGCIHYGQIYTYYGTYADKTKSFVSPELARKLRIARKGDLVIATTSENIEDVCKAVAWLGNESIAVSGDAYIFKHKQNPKYISYLFQTDYFSEHKKKYATGTKVIRVSGDNVAKIKIPVPPLPVQEETVRILDKFIALEAELEAELEARSVQYEYYRNELLSFEVKGVEWKTLRDVAYFPKERISCTDIDQHSYIGVDNLLPNKKGKTFSSYVPIKGTLIRFMPDDILIGNIRPYLKKIWKANSVGGTNGDIIVIRINEDFQRILNANYLYYLLSSNDFFEYDMQYAKGAKMPRGDKEAVLRYAIPVPPLDKQERIVSILDKFDALVNDTSVGLPAEITARRQQYEYYRDKLLTFKELNKNG